MNRRELLQLSAACLPASFSLAATAEDIYPSHAIQMVVPFPPGGVADLTARPVAEAMSRRLQQPVVIENKGGAGGGIGMAYVARARPDGYTLVMALQSFVVLPEADRILGRAPMYSLAQLKPVARFTADPTVLVVNAASPWTSYADFIAALRAAPEQYSFGSSGNYGTMHVPMEQLEAATHTRMLHVPFTGAGPAVVALLSKQVDALATGPSTITEQVRSGRLRALAQWGDARLPSLPDVLTLRELGVPIGYSQWTGLFVPADTPEAIVAQLRNASREAAQDPMVVKALQSAGSVVQYLDAPQFERFVAADASAMVTLVKQIGKVE